MKKLLALVVALFSVGNIVAQGDVAQRAQAEQLFAQERFADAMPLYSNLVSLYPSDRDLNYRLGTCMIHSGGDKEKAVGFLKFATQDASVAPLAHYQLGRALHVTYRFTDAMAAYAVYKAKADKKTLVEHPVDVLEKQCRNGTQLLSNLKEIEVHSKVEVDEKQFDRFYDLTDMGGRIVEVPDELKSSLDRKSDKRSFFFKSDKGGTIYFSSYGKDGKTGRDIYTTELLPDGSFREPRKLAGYVNTDQDEDFAFLHPDGKTFYFSSKGHNSMGGYDVFKANYDRGLDVFSSPENLDFAVNTPDDDVLYIVDPEGKEACFASARDSRQGSIHVYRVSTTQQTLDLVILKGQYLSEIDAADRKAHIIVEDAVTRKQVADVRTGLDGTYVLSLPHSGRYKFMVEAGPGGRTHAGVVEAPRVDAARAYRQELVLQNPGGQEKLLIKNYFDEPLADDLIALALDEIKRRSKLDVTVETPVADIPQEVKPVGDVMTQAGFAGNISTTDAQRLAQAEQKELTALADELDEQGDAAYTAALQAAAEAEKATTAAAQHIRNADAATDPGVKSSEMTEAALERERARTANLRAKAALRAGQDLEKESMTVAQQAAAADKLSTDIAAAINGKNDAASVKLLTTLKERLDVKNGPDAVLAAHERTRRGMVEKEAEASRAVQAAAARRDEEDELVTRINKLERERDATKSKSKKEEFDREILTYQGQLTALRDETAAAFAKAKGMEGETAVMRSQSALMKALDEGTAPMVTTELTVAQVAELGQRLAVSEMNTAALPIDERFEAAIAEEVERQKTIANDWTIGDDALATNSDRSATQTRNVDGTEQLNIVPTQAQRDGLSGQTTGDRTTDTGTKTTGIQEGASALSTTRTEAQRDALANQPNGRDSGIGNVPAQERADADTNIRTAVVVPVDSVLPSTPDPGSSLVSSLDPAQQRFLRENELAELEQLRAAEKNKDERARLDARIAEVKQQLATDAAASAVDASAQQPIVMVSDTPTIARPALDFDRATTDDQLIGKLFSNYTSDKEHTLKLADPVERATAGHGLELMLIDSLQAESDRQTDVLESAPERADELLPRIERLRQMRLSHTALAERYLNEAEAMERVATESIDPNEDYAIDPGTDGAQAGLTPVRTTGTEHLDSYIAIVPDVEFVLESPVEYRNTKVADAVVLRDQDIEQMVRMEDEIDSLESVLEGMERGKAYDKIRKQADKLIDDRVILRTEMGARSAYLSEKEYAYSSDSLKGVRNEVNKVGLAPDEPLVQMAMQLEEDARTQFTKAQAFRKKADRVEDIVVRDSLFREAFSLELQALRGMDQAITVNNFILSADFERGTTRTYAAIERDMFGPDEPLVVAVPQGKVDPKNTTTTADTLTTVITETGTDSAVVLSDDRSGERTALEGGQGDDRAGIDLQQGKGNDVATTSAEQSNTDRQSGVPSTSSDPSTPGNAPGTTAAGELAGAETGQRPIWNSLGSEELAAKANEAMEDARMMEISSVELADAANALRDSASTAKRRDKEALEQQAVLAQKRSDELHAKSLAHAATSDSLLALQREAEQAQAFRDRLNRYYYMSGHEENVVLGQTDQSRYFEARSKALEQRERSDLVRMEAISTRQLAQALVDQSKAVLAAATGAQGATTEEMAQASALNERAVQLHQRADSLEAVSARSDGSAAMNESQAAALLQGLPAERSTEIMAFEQRTRRTEPMLAEARSTQQQSAAENSTTPEEVNAGSNVVPPPAQGNAVPRSDDLAADTARAVQGAAPIPIGDRPLLPMLEADVFTILPPGERKVEAIVLDGPMPAGLVYKVQIGAFRFPISEELFSDMTPVTGETVGNGMVRYMAGMFTEYGNADNAKGQVRDRGYRDAFVVAYMNGKRISLTEARVAQGAPPIPGALAQNRPEIVPSVNVIPTPAAVVETTPIQLRPATTPVVVPAAPEDEAAVLAKYPASAQEVVSAFAPASNAVDYYNVSGAAPAKQVETIKGLFFTVQVGVYSKPVALDKLFNISPLNSELTETSKVRYTTGVYLDTEKARVRKDATVAFGVKDAFVTAYLNGKRIPVRDARALLARFGNGVLADPALATP